MSIRSFLLLGVLLLQACASISSGPPEVKLYLLESLPTQVSNDAQKQISVGRISVPGYLNQSNLVMRHANQRFEIAHYHAWAESLPTSIRRVLREQLNQSVNHYTFVNQCHDCGSLDIEIEHFYPTSDGDVYLSGYYTLTAQRANDSIYRSFTISAQLDADGYDAAVKEMREVIVRLSQQIAAQLPQ